MERQIGPTMYVSFDFYNGAMSTDQCMELRAVLEVGINIHIRPST
jgi:hypothetical protein